MSAFGGGFNRWRSAFRLDRVLPMVIRGLVLRLALLRMASICRFEASAFLGDAGRKHCSDALCHQGIGCKRARILLQKGLAFPFDWSVTDSAGRGDSAGISPRKGGA
jgi:hypothetical protein